MWQPIDTAEKEYGPDILGSDGKRVFLMYYSEDDGWQDSTAPDHVNGTEYPTHWMPLPAPPCVETGIPIIKTRDATADVLGEIKE